MLSLLIALMACGPASEHELAASTASGDGAGGASGPTRVCGSVSDSGVYTAPASPEDCTPATPTQNGPATDGTTTPGSTTAGTTTPADTTTAGTTTTADTTTTGTTTPAAATAHGWTITQRPPTLTSPTTITLPGSYLSTISHSLCSGPGYVINLDNSKDYIIRTTAVLHAPVQINGGRNVRIIGMHIDLDSSTCNSSGLSGYAPGVIALRVAQVGTTYIEGAYIDVRRKSTDCIVARNLIGNYEALSKGYSETSARGARDVVVQNSVCRGMSGDSNVHGDILQTQGAYELFRTIVLENVSTDSNCEGTVLEPRQGYPLANQIVVRRFDYQRDSRYTPNKNGTGLWTGGPVMHSSKAYAYDGVYLQSDVVRQYSPSYVVTIPKCNAGGIYCNATPGTNRFASPGTGAVSSGWTGINYVSPF